MYLHAEESVRNFCAEKSCNIISNDLSNQLIGVSFKKIGTHKVDEALSEIYSY